jgi:hypothetical protein
MALAYSLLIAFELNTLNDVISVGNTLFGV